MKIPFVDLAREHAPFAEALHAAVNDAIDSGSYIMGETLAAFEVAFARYVGAAHAIGVSSGTDALTLALYEREVGPGDVVVTTPYTFYSPAGVAARLGAEVAFVDIDPVTFNLDPDALARFLANDPRAARTKVVLPVHLFGLAADLEGLRALTRPRGIWIVEDAAQGVDAIANDGRHVGTHGKLGCFSFFPTKNLGALGDGGAVVTNDDEVAARIRSLRSYGMSDRLVHERLGGNHRLDALQAAALLVKLEHLESKRRRRELNAAAYDDAFGELSIAVPARPTPPARHAHHQYVVRLGAARDRVREALTAEGIETKIYYPTPLHLQPVFASLGYREGDLVHAERAARETLALPIRPSLTLQERTTIIDAVRRALGA